MYLLLDFFFLSLSLFPCRRNIILGGVFYFDMLEIPPQPKKVGNWVICQLETPQVLKTVSWHADYKPPLPPDENTVTKKTPEEIEREIKLQEMELQKLVQLVLAYTYRYLLIDKYIYLVFAGPGSPQVAVVVALVRAAHHCQVRDNQGERKKYTITTFSHIFIRLFVSRVREIPCVKFCLSPLPAKVGAHEALLELGGLLRHQVRRGKADALLQDHLLRHLRPLRLQVLQPAPAELGAGVSSGPGRFFF